MENKLNYFMLLILLLTAGMLKAEEPEKKKEILFNVIKAPSITIAELDKEIVLNWSGDTNLSVIENYQEHGYSFQGYNVYQFAAPSDYLYEGKKIATYDIVDGIDSIWDFDYNPDSGKVLLTLIQRGFDSGIQRYISIKTDALNDKAPLQNGAKYYYGVSAYVYNPDTNAVPRSLETAINVYTAIPRYNAPNGEDDIVNSGELSDNKILHEGSADASVKVTVADPSQLKDADYEAAFEKQDYLLDQDGKWKPSDIIGKNFQVKKNMSSPYFNGLAIYAPKPGEYILKIKVHLNMATQVNFDGIRFTFPQGMIIKNGWYVDSEGNNVYGMNLTDSTYGFGPSVGAGNSILADNDVINLECSALPVPFMVSYMMWKDGSTDPALNASGTVIFDTVYYNYKTLTVWNLTNIKTGENLLTDQTVINRQDQLYGDWLTSASDTVINGLQIFISGSYDEPIDFSSALLNREGAAPTSVEGSFPNPEAIVLSNYSIFSNIDTSAAWHTYGSGIKDVNVLGKDLELRYTGVWEESKPGLFTIKEGTGSVATLYSALSEADLQNHPLNPNPGSASPFLIRIPFEVWNKTDNRQVNVLMRDRLQPANANPFYAWNPINRMYFWICETAYHPNSIIDLIGDEKDSLTWTLVSWSANWQIGDKVEIKYTNPIRPGKDVFRFSTKASVIEIESDEPSTPTKYYLSQNYPNPFNPATTINFAVPKAGNVKITVYDILGREIELLTNKEYSIGAHKIEWNASRYSSGVYFYKLESSAFSLAKKMLLIK